MLAIQIKSDKKSAGVSDYHYVRNKSIKYTKNTYITKIQFIPDSKKFHIAFFNEEHTIDSYILRQKND